jgi:hypothetical protein
VCSCDFVGRRRNLRVVGYTMKTIPLTNSNEVALVSDEDYADVSQYRWFVKRSDHKCYVCRSVRVGNKVRTIRLQRYIAQRILGDIELTRAYDVHHVKGYLDNQRENLGVIDHYEHAMYQ